MILARLAAIIAVGLLSRLQRTGFPILDKYLGDALYAAMVYEILRLTLRRGVAQTAALAATTMTAIEMFQLTGFAARLITSESLPVRLFARLLGTDFGGLDLLAYAAGIAAICASDARRSPGSPLPKN